MRNIPSAIGTVAFAAVFAAGSALAADAKKEEEEVKKAEAAEMAEAPKEEMAEEMAEEPAPAPEPLRISISGNMEQWVGMTDLDAPGDDNGGFAQNSDSEIHFRGKLESDSGLTFSVKVELEANSGSSHIDESQLTVGGGFGQIVLGSEDEAQSLMHYGHQDAGIGLNAGDTGLWLGGDASFGLNTAGWHGDPRMISYYTPRVAGAQFGASYIPRAGDEDNTKAPKNNDESAWSMGANFKSDLGGASVALSVGHYEADGMEMEFAYMPTAAPAADESEYRLTVVEYATHMAAVEKGLQLLDPTFSTLAGADLLEADEVDTATKVQDIISGGFTSGNAIVGSMDSMKKGDNASFSNVGLQVGFGGFSFNVAYATRESGMYTTMDMPVRMTGAEMYAKDQSNAVQANGLTDATGGGNAAMIIDSTHMFDHDNDPDTAKVPESEATSATAGDQVNDLANETWMGSKVVEDKSKDYDVMSFGVMYSDGPMGISLGHIASDYDNGDESEATMVSVGYVLAPGVSSKTSIFQAEGTKSGKTVEGTGFVTGITIGF